MHLHTMQLHTMHLRDTRMACPFLHPFFGPQETNAPPMPQNSLRKRLLSAAFLRPKPTETERMKHLKIDFTHYGFDPAMLPENMPGTTPARVIAVYKERYELVCEQGAAFGRLKPGAYYGGEELFPTAGDFVLIDYNGQGDSRIVRTLPRKSCFDRLDPSSSGHAAQAVAANFDYVCLVQSLNQNFNLRRLERYLTLAWQSGAIPVVILTKTDLAEDFGAQVSSVAEIAAGVEIFPVSSKTGDGLEVLSAFLKPGSTVVFLGSSGVGKSSLVNALAGEEVMAVSEIREEDSRGRHTTTHRQLTRLKSGLLVIDTPGMRELGMWDVTQGIGQSFADVERYFGACRFRDCKHQSEPGCAVQAAIAAGELSAERWESYQRLKREAKYSDDKAAFLQKKQARNKSLATHSRSRQKAGPRYDD